MFEGITEPTVLEETGDQTELFDDSDVQMNEFEFTADLAVELPEEVEPEKFFGYLMRVMIAHTEAYGKWKLELSCLIVFMISSPWPLNCYRV